MDDDTLLGARVVDGAGHTVGSVSALLIDPVSFEGRWLQLSLAAEPGPAVLPLMAASVDATGRLVIPYDVAAVAAAPKPDGPLISVELADALLRHYGFDR